MKKILNVIGICFGIVCIGYGIIGSYSFFEGLGFILFSLPLISWFRTLLVEYIQSRKKRVLTYIGIIITSLIFIGIGSKPISDYSGNNLDTAVSIDKNNKENIKEDDKNKELTVDEILSNPKKYEGKEIAPALRLSPLSSQSAVPSGALPRPPCPQGRGVAGGGAG